MLHIRTLLPTMGRRKGVLSGAFFIGQGRGNCFELNIGEWVGTIPLFIFLLVNRKKERLQGLLQN